MGTKVYDNALDLITFTRASGGTALRKISYGPELVTNGDGSSLANWVPFQGGALSLTDGGIRVTNTIGFGGAYQLIPTVAGALYVISGEMVVKSAGANSWDFQVGSTPGGFNIISYVIGQWDSGQKFFVAPSTTTYVTINVGNNGSGEYKVHDNISVKEVLFDRPDGTLTLFNHPNNIPRIEYDAAGAVKGLLVEEARTNLVTHSAAFDDASWSKINATITPNSTTAPDGSSSADTAVVTGASGRVVDSVSLTAAPHTCSVFMKQDTQTDTLLRLFDGTSTFSLTVTWAAGIPSFVSNTGSDYSITDYGNGWWRLSITATTLASAGGSFQIYVNGFNSSGSAFLWGAQVEAGAFPTSYIPTAGATATRAADIASIPVSAFGYNQQAGSVVVQADMFNSTGLYWLASFGVDAANSVQFYTTSSAIRTFIRAGGVDQALFNSATSVLNNTPFSFAAGLKPDDIASITNGGAIVTDTSALLPLISANLRIGSSTAGLNQLNGHIKSITYYPRRLSNAQLQELTT